MNLLEYEAKQALSKYGIPIPKGIVVADSKQTADAVGSLKPPFMVKAQVPSGGRGKAGGILPAQSAVEAEAAAGKLLGSTLKGLPVRQVLVEEKLTVKRELYVGFTVDRLSRCYVALASTAGGVEIEETAAKTPEAICRIQIDPLLGMRSFDALALAKQLGYAGSQLLDLSAVIFKLYRMCMESDAETAEANPLVETNEGWFVAADARMVIDDNALFRHPEYQAEETQALTPQEAKAGKYGLAYVKLDGDVGVIGNGAGLVMATLDLLNLFGGKPADFLDVGGGASKEAIKAAAEIVLADSDTKAVLVNVLGGITRCDEVAGGIVESLKDANVGKPLVVRLIGTNQKEGQRILADAGISVRESMEEAAEEAVMAAKGRRR